MPAAMLLNPTLVSSFLEHARFTHAAMAIRRCVRQISSWIADWSAACPSPITLGWALSAFAHDDGYYRSRQERDDADRQDRCTEAEVVCDEAGRQRADGVAQVTPEPIDAQRASTPGRVRGVGHGCNQARVHHRRAQAEQNTRHQPPLEAAGQSRQKQAGGLNP